MRFKQPRPKNDDERILPLINVVFLLLIFFMLAGRLTASDPFQVTPAHSVSTDPDSTPEILVLAGADGRFALDGAIMDEADLKMAIAARIPVDGGHAKAPRVRLKADANAQATDIVAVMEALREAGVEKLKLMTIPARR